MKRPRDPLNLLCLLILGGIALALLFVEPPEANVDIIKLVMVGLLGFLGKGAWDHQRGDHD